MSLRTRSSSCVRLVGSFFFNAWSRRGRGSNCAVFARLRRIMERLRTLAAARGRMDAGARSPRRQQVRSSTLLLQRFCARRVTRCKSARARGLYPLQYGQRCNRAASAGPQATDSKHGLGCHACLSCYGDGGRLTRHQNPATDPADRARNGAAAAEPGRAVLGAAPHAHGAAPPRKGRRGATEG